MSAVVAQTASAARARRRRLTERARGERRLAALLIGPAAIVMVAVLAYPIIDAVVLSLQRSDLRLPHATAFIGSPITELSWARRCGGGMCCTP